MMLYSSMKESSSEVNVVSSGNQLDSSGSSELRLGTYGQGGIDVSHEKCERNAISEIEDVDIEIRFSCSVSLSDEKDCMWLSSAMPPMFTGDVTFFDMYQSGFISEDPIDTSLTLESMRSGAGEGPNDDTFDYNGIKHPSMGSSEDAESGYRWFLSEDSSNVNSSWSELGTDDESSSLHDHDLDIINIWLPLFDIEGEESNWDAEAFDILNQDFPSPPCHTQVNLQTRSSSFSYNQTSRQLLDAQALLGSPNSPLNTSPKHVLDVKSLPNDSVADEPLFWPFDQKSYWSIELEGNYLGTSPFESISSIKRPTGCHTSKSVQFLWHQRNNSSLHRKTIQQGCKGGITCSSLSSELLLADGKSRGSSSQMSHNTDLTTGIRGSIRVPSEKAACSLSKKRGVNGRHQSNSFRNDDGINQKTSLDQCLLEFEADDFRIYLTGGFPIEVLVGLDEFDGHEGIERMETGWGMEEMVEDPLLENVLSC